MKLKIWCIKKHEDFTLIEIPILTYGDASQILKNIKDSGYLHWESCIIPWHRINMIEIKDK